MEIPVTYRESSALNQSRLKRILQHPRLFIEETVQSEFDEASDHIDIGDAVDLLLTGGEREFHEQFIVGRIPRPTGQMGDFCWAKFKYRDFDTADQLAFDEVGIKRPKTVQEYLEKFEKEGRPYYDELLAAEGKRLLTPQKFETISRIVEAIKNNPHVYKHIDPQSEEYDIFYQVVATWTMYVLDTPIKCKGLIDCVKVHKKTREATIIDVKTTRHSVGNFFISYLSYRYDFQGGWYHFGLNQDEETKAALGITSVSENIIFVVGSTKFPDQSLAYHMNGYQVGMTISGYTHEGKYYPGIIEALSRYVYHTKHDKWDYRQEEYEANFNVPIPKISG